MRNGFMTPVCNKKYDTIITTITTITTIPTITTAAAAAFGMFFVVYSWQFLRRIMAFVCLLDTMIQATDIVKTKESRKYCSDAKLQQFRPSKRQPTKEKLPTFLASKSSKVPLHSFFGKRRKDEKSTSSTQPHPFAALSLIQASLVQGPSTQILPTACTTGASQQQPPPNERVITAVGTGRPRQPIMSWYCSDWDWN